MCFMAKMFLNILLNKVSEYICYGRNFKILIYKEYVTKKFTNELAQHF